MNRTTRSRITSNARRIAGAVLGLTVALGVQDVSAQAGPPIKVGGTCDRTGSTRIIGAEMCSGVVDYIALVNRKGGVEGHPIAFSEIDHGYTAPRAVEAYDRFRKEGAVTVINYGVPTLLATIPRYMEDKIPVLNTGTGRADAVDGQAWPYIFPGTASYWSQTGVALKYIKDNGAKRGTRIAYLHLDSPAGREGLAILEGIAQKEGYTLLAVPLQPPGLDMASKVNQITREFKADWVIGSLFGAPAAESIKEFRRAGFPLNRFVSFAYGAGDPDVAAAGWETAQGYLGIQFAGVGRNHAVIQDIIKMMRDDGKDVPGYVGSAYYNRGVLTAALMTESLRLAIRNHGMPLTGDKVRRGYESIRNFDALGLGPPITLTPQDHEGGGYLRVYQVRGNEWVPVSEWIRGYRDDVLALVRKANGK
jgi:branched-chain amino acid transport system substrate-binding protein